MLALERTEKTSWKDNRVNFNTTETGVTKWVYYSKFYFGVYRCMFTFFIKNCKNSKKFLMTETVCN